MPANFTLILLKMDFIASLDLANNQAGTVAILQVQFKFWGC